MKKLTKNEWELLMFALDRYISYLYDDENNKDYEDLYKKLDEIKTKEGF